MATGPESDEASGSTPSRRRIGFLPRTIAIVVALVAVSVLPNQWLGDARASLPDESTVDDVLDEAPFCDPPYGRVHSISGDRFYDFTAVCAATWFGFPRRTVIGNCIDGGWYVNGWRDLVYTGESCGLSQAADDDVDDPAG